MMAWQGHLNVFGADYETRDGTGERNYIDVEGLARAVLAVIEFASNSAGCERLT